MTGKGKNVEVAGSGKGAPVFILATVRLKVAPAQTVCGGGKFGVAGIKNEVMVKLSTQEQPPSVTVTA